MKKNIIENYIFSDYILLILHLNVSTLSSLKTWMKLKAAKEVEKHATFHSRKNPFLLVLILFCLYEATKRERKSQNYQIGIGKVIPNQGFSIRLLVYKNAIWLA